jgi:YD repeat-containing protein
LQEPVITLKYLQLGYLLLILPATLSGACRDCAQSALGGPSENRFTAYDALCKGAACRDAGFPQLFVNTANLTLFARVTDLTFGGPAPTLTIEHSFNMDDTRTGVLGAGWSFSLGDTLTPDTDGSLVLRRGSGRIDRFATAPGASTYFALTGTRDALTQAADGTYRLRSATNSTTWNFRADGKLASIQDGTVTRVSLDYDSSGHLTTAHYRGRSIQFTADSNGRIASIADGAGRSVSFTYSDDGHLTGQSNADGSNAAYAYDAAGNLTGITYLGGKYAIAYTGDAPNVSVASITTPDGAVRAYDIPRTPSEIRVTDGNGDASLYVSTAQGLVQSVRDAAGNTTSYTYDAAGNRTGITNPAGETTSFAYDSAGNLTAATDSASNRWTADYNGGLLAHVTDPRRNVWAFQYDAGGNLTSVTDPLADAVAATRTANGQIVSLTDADGNQSVWQYNSDGLLTAFTDAAGGKWSYNYDGAARPSDRTDPGGSKLHTDYTSQNRVAALSTGDATVNFDYSAVKRDSQGRLPGYTDSFGNTIAYKYDAAGQLTSMTLPGGKTVTYQYDHLHRLSAVADWTGTTAIYRYDTAGYPLSLSISGGPVTIWQYDTARNLRAIVTTGADGTPIAGYRYTVDAAGNRTAVSALEPIATVGALPAYSFTYDTANRPATRSDGQNYSYDARGNLSAISGSRTANFGYDPFGRLTSAPAADAVVYGYDSTGLRVTRHDSLGDHRYVWDLSGSKPRVVMETDGSNNPIAWYIYGLGLLWKVTPDGNGKPYFYYFDGDGNVVAVYAAEGIVAGYRYDASGNVVASQETNYSRLFTTGGSAGWLDDGNGLIFTGSEFRFPELRLTLPSAADPSPPIPDLRPKLRGAGACFFEGIANCAFANGRER